MTINGIRYSISSYSSSYDAIPVHAVICPPERSTLCLGHLSRSGAGQSPLGIAPSEPYRIPMARHPAIPAGAKDLMFLK